MKYNGHKNWNHWNVSLWINNDESLYSLARDYVREYKSRDLAALHFLHTLQENGVTKTPDGAPYTLTTIKAAMIDM